jgi:phosphoribosyl-ATP pyrophosphohydrolase
VARLLHKGPDAFLKKIGEEATEVVMAAKDADHGGDRTKIVNEVADLWFHTMVALAHYGFSPAEVVAELERREGTSGIEEKACARCRPAKAGWQRLKGHPMANDIVNVEPDDSLKTWGWVSYILHLIVAIGAVLPGAQASVLLLLLALVIDFVKRDDAAGTWQASHFSWRIRSVLWAGLLYIVTRGSGCCSSFRAGSPGA